MLNQASDAPELRRVSGTDLVDLFLRPARFFGSLDLDWRPWYITAAVCTGITTAAGRIDQNLMRADLGQARPGWDEVAPGLLDSWINYWLFVIGFGLLSAVVYWYLGGWWYRVRLRWSGAEDPDRRLARLVMVSSALVMSLPTLIYAALETVTFENYRAAWSAEGLLGVTLLVFPFWAVYASYRGVRTRFDVGKWRSRTWFLILPVVVFAFALGVIAVLYAFLEPVMGGPAGDRFA